MMLYIDFLAVCKYGIKLTYQQFVIINHQRPAVCEIQFAKFFTCYLQELKWTFHSVGV